MTIKRTVRKFGGVLKENSPAILTAAGVVGVVSTAVLASKSTLKAHQILEYEYRGLYDGHMVRFFKVNPDFRKKAFLQIWKEFIPPLVTGIGTITFIIAAHKAHTRRTAAVASMYALADTTLTKYRDNVVEAIGENKEKEIREKTSNDIVKPLKDNQGVYETGNGQHLCYDQLTGRYFRSDIESVRKAQNDFNHNLLTDMWSTLNEFYMLLDIPNVEIGETLGWNTDNMMNITFSTMITDSGEPCLVLHHDVLPSQNFRAW